MLLNLEELVRKYNLKIDAVCQPGAHFGQEQGLYDKLGIPDKNRYYFEPVPVTFSVLSKNINGRGQIFNYALGNKNKLVTMFLEENNQGQSSSVLPPLLHLKQYPHIHFNKTIEVPMIRLDDYLEEIFRNNNYQDKNWLINIDTQGTELEVLFGMTKLLPYVTCIICEVNRAEVYKGCAMVGEIDNFLETFGFTRKETNWEGGSWGDSLYIKKQ